MSNDDEWSELPGKWSELPGDLVGLIIDKLKTNTFSLLEYIRFGAVCLEWRRILQSHHYKKIIKLPSNLPVLLLPSEFDDPATDYLPPDPVPSYIYRIPDPYQYYYKRSKIWKGQDQTRHKSTRSFYSLSEGQVNRDFRLRVPYYKNCRGSSYGWLITVDEEEQPDGTYIYPVRLLNPFRSVNNEIQLPPLTPIPELREQPNESYYLIKAYLSANPSSLSNPAADLLVFGMYGSNRFGFCRPGDSVWTYLPLENKFRPIQDLICYKGRFLAIIQNGSVLELVFPHHLLHPKLPTVKFFALPPPNGNKFNKKYLVESGGDLLQVQRHTIDIDDDDDYLTTGFRAFKLKEDEDDDAHDAHDDFDFQFDFDLGDKDVTTDYHKGVKNNDFDLEDKDEDVTTDYHKGVKNKNQMEVEDDPKYWVEMLDGLHGCSFFLGDNSSISLSASADLPGLLPDCIYFTDENSEEIGDNWDGPRDIGIFNFKDRTIVLRHGNIMPPPIWIQPML